MSIAIKRLERAIGDLPKVGMQTGSHKVKLDLSDAKRLIVELNALQAERDALAAQAVALVIALTNLHDVAAMCDGWESFPQKSLDEALDALSATPQHQLAAHDAEVAKAAFIAGYSEGYTDCQVGYSERDVERVVGHAENYAASLNK